MKGAGHDHARRRYPYPGEQYILSVDRYQIEVMDHLDEPPATGAVIFCTFPRSAMASDTPPASLRSALQRSVQANVSFL